MSPAIGPTLTPLIPALRRYARALLRDRDDADDLVQDCLERAIRRWHQRRTDHDHTRAWLFAILHNLAMTRFVRAARAPATVALDTLANHPDLAAATTPDPHQRRDLLAALARLPADQRAVLLLVGVEDLSYAQTASVLGVPLGTVMSRLSRARDRLHALLGEARAANSAPTSAPTSAATARPRLRAVK